MTWGVLAAAVDDAAHTTAPAPRHTRDLAQITDAHIAWQETGTGPQHALSLPALFAVVRLIASNIDQLDLTTTAGTVPTWLRQPRSYGSALDQGDLVQYLATQMALQGRAYLLARRAGDGWRLDAVHNGSVGVDASTFGVVDLTFTFNGEPIDRLPYNGAGPGPYLIHIPYLVTAAHPEGTSPVAEAWQAIAGYLSVEKQAATLLDGGTRSGGRLETDADITAETARRYRDQWVTNSRLGVIPVLGAGLRYENDIISPKDATWIESRLANAQSVASMYGVPNDWLGMTMAGGSSSLSYSNAQDQNRRMRVSCLELFTSQMSDALSPLLRAPGRGPDDEQSVIFDYTRWEASADASSQPDT